MVETKTWRWAKRVMWTIGGIIAFLFAFIWVGEHIPDFMRWKNAREAVVFEAALEADRQTLRAMEMADSYGSTTPEGTIVLIVDALKANDITLASKYYYVLDQEKSRVSLEKQRAEKGNLNIAISFFEDLLRGTKGCNKEGDGCTLEYEYLTSEDQYVELINNQEKQFVPKGSPEIESNEFILNQYTGLWKARE